MNDRDQKGSSQTNGVIFAWQQSCLLGTNNKLQRPAMSSRSNGRPEPEVIVNVRVSTTRRMSFLTITGTVLINQFADGLSYSKAKLEEAFRPGGILEKPPPKPHKEALPSFVKKEDVELIVRFCLSCILYV